MARKKPKHLYEILGKSATQPTAAPGQEVRSPETLPRKEEQVRLAETLMRQDLASDKALGNVVVIRKDTAVVGIILAIVMWIIAFLVGRWTVQKQVPSVSPTLKSAVEGTAEPPVTAVSAPDTAESARLASSAKEKYYLVIAAYDESQKKLADEAAEFLRSKGYSGVVVEKSGNKVVIRLRNFQSNSDPDALRIQKEIRALEYKGRKEFITAYFVPVR